MKLKDKVVLVTGSSIGIGREAAKQFSEKGAKVIITYNKDKEEGENVLSECRNAILLHLDVRKDKSIKELVDKTIKEHERIDVLVNNAGVIRWIHLIDQTTEDIEEQINVNLTGLVKVTRAFLPQFMKQKEGIIINVSSGAGKQGYSDFIHQNGRYVFKRPPCL